MKCFWLSNCWFFLYILCLSFLNWFIHFSVDVLIYKMIMVPNEKENVLQSRLVPLHILLRLKEKDNFSQMCWPIKSCSQKTACLPEMSFRVCLWYWLIGLLGSRAVDMSVRMAPCKFEHRNFLMKPAAIIHLFMCSSNV